MDATLGPELGLPADGPSTLPAVLAVAAPLSVVTALEVTGNVLVAFAAYHLVFCLVLPPAVLGLRGRPGIVEGLALEPPSAEGWAAGIATGLAMGGSILAAYLLVGETVLDPVAVLQRLAPWGIEPGVEVPLFAYMLVFNSGAEELFWRGYLHTEATARLGQLPGILLVALAFTSYHVYTLASLLGDLALALVAATGILAGALVWAGLRQRYGSLWPAVLGHVGATAGYMTVFVLLV